MPDGKTMDLLGSFKTSDNIVFVWAAQDLPLGEYTLTVDAVDIAGNELKDRASKFTIGKRKPFRVALRPGWNLVSVPGQPADADINAVVTSRNIDVVQTYDPTMAGGWVTAVRDGDTFVGPLKTVDADKAYWVHTSAFDPIEVDIPGLTAGAQMLPLSIDLSAGWNLIPVSRSETDPTAAGYLSGLDWSRAYGYDNVTNRFESIAPTDKGKTLTIGQGYFIYLNTPGTLVP